MDEIGAIGEKKEGSESKGLWETILEQLQGKPQQQQPPPPPEPVQNPIANDGVKLGREAQGACGPGG
jgi:hypothetical protein